MSAGGAVRGALVARLRGDAALAGVAIFDGEPSSRALPRIDVAEPQEIDWSAKGFRGRELRTAVTVRVADGQAGRLAAMTAAVERAGEGLDGDIGGWRVAGALFLRVRAVADKNGRAALIEHRVRVVEL